MKKSVIAIGLDAADPIVLEQWMAQGHLPNLSRLRQTGAYGRLTSVVDYGRVSAETADTEAIWTMFLTGCLPDKTGYWSSVNLHRGTYEISHQSGNAAYNFQDYLPFYALGQNHSVCIFDIPGAPLADVKGLQVTSWGIHATNTPSQSQPPDLLPQLIQQYGRNPLLHHDNGYWWDEVYLKRIQQGIHASTTKRSAICRDLLQRQPWDLFITVFNDIHLAGHDLWHLGQAHPLTGVMQTSQFSQSAMLDAFESVDRALGDILEVAPADAYKLVFSVHGMGANSADILTRLGLCEFLYRLSFPNQFKLAPGKSGTPCPPINSHPQRHSWAGEIWQHIHDPNPLKRLLRRWAPGTLQAKLDRLLAYPALSTLSLPNPAEAMFWHPAVWYQPYWSHMRAFALPFFEAGYIRLNVKGREPSGIVDRSEYDTTCNELTEKLYRLVDGRTGQPLVKQVIRTRLSALQDDVLLPDPDLVVLWHEQATDVMDSPDVGRIGPVTYCRTGGHRPGGFMVATGPEIPAGSELPLAQVIDLAPTFLDLMGAPIPAHCQGQSLRATIATKPMPTQSVSTAD